MKIKINESFASNGSVDEEDVRVIKRALNWLGYYTPYEKIGLTTIPDTGVFKAIKAFQADQKLAATGAVRPDDDTIKALSKTISEKLRGTIKMKNNKDSGQHIWRTTQDDKVRGSHAAREGKTFSWTAPPEGGHPAEDYIAAAGQRLLTQKPQV